MLSKEQLDSFNENGFLVIDALLDEDDLRPVELEYYELLNQIALKFYQKGLISQIYESLDFSEKFQLLLEADPDLYRYLNISLPLENENLNPETFTMHAGSAVFHLLRHEKLLDVAESILGGEIFSNPVQQIRMKPPSKNLSGKNAIYSNIGTTTWHQDMVSLMREADDSDILTIWIAVSDAYKENGCLVSVPQSHKLGPMTHCPGKIMASEPNVPQSIMREHKAKPLPVKKGGAILFNKYNIHCSLPNHSNQLRWSFDLRYCKTGQPTGRPAFPGFIARSRNQPDTELHDPAVWQGMWDKARSNILSGRYAGPVFESEKWERFSSLPVCA